MKTNANTSKPNNAQLLFGAIKNANLEEVQRLLESGIDANIRGANEFTPLIFLAEQEKMDEDIQVKIAQALLDRGAKTHLTLPKTQKTALHSAAAFGRAKLCELLVNSEAQLEARNTIMSTPLTLAASFEGNAAAIRKLLELGANIEARTAKDERSTHADNGRQLTALLYAVDEDQVENFKVLVEFGANLSARTGNDYCLIHLLDLEKKGMIRYLEFSEDEVKDIHWIQQDMNRLQIARKTQRIPAYMEEVQKQIEEYREKLTEAISEAHHGDFADRVMAQQSIDAYRRIIENIERYGIERPMTDEEYLSELAEHYLKVRPLLNRVIQRLRPETNIEDAKQQMQMLM